MPPDARATFPVSFPVDLAITLGPLQRGGSDPTIWLEGQEAWRACRTPRGPASVHLRMNPDEVEAEAWGAGSDWILERIPQWLGFDDTPETFLPRNGLLRELHRRHIGLRLGGTGLVFEALLPTILEQKVPGVEAWASYARLVRTLGEPAPGDVGLFLQPTPQRLLETPYWAVHRLGIEQRRFAVIQYAASRAARLERTTSLEPQAARRQLVSLPGIGPWSAAEVSVGAYGDRDAVSVGDYHLPHQVAWALAGEPRGSDQRMIELLEPYRGHRARVIRLLALSGIQAPRFGPRMRLRKIAAI
ncbi:MAG TPA: DNA-3-methyladenine glycosylase 2 family protein [Candidatus Dormibacteraeota bacterium]|nr:DNA-3-methyladenine glycosylase 2 family protein [Candidatus Dormibacteraeota bacterium]